MKKSCNFFKTRKMKIIISNVLLIIFSYTVAISQTFEFVCPMTDITDPNLVGGFGTNGLLSNSGLEFFAGNQECERVTLNVNYIFLYKDDGTGNWDFNNTNE